MRAAAKPLTHSSVEADSANPMQLSFCDARSEDLEKINRLIEAAIGTWPIGSRLRRLVATPLRYNWVDFQDFEMVLCYKAAAEIGVAVWQPDAPLQMAESHQATLLHGLYVAPDAQGYGVGRGLLSEIAQRARARNQDTLYVRAERFATGFFRRVGGRQLQAQESPEAGDQAYPHRFLLSVANIDGTGRRPM